MGAPGVPKRWCFRLLESWNRANAVIFYGKSGDLATSRRDEQEMSVCCPIDTLLAGAGVCRDFAHLVVGAAAGNQRACPTGVGCR